MFATLKRMLSGSRDTVTEPAAQLSSPAPADPPPATVTAEERSDQPVDFTLRGAYLSGWFHKETGELFTGFRVDADGHVLGVGCGGGTIGHLCGSPGA